MVDQPSRCNEVCHVYDSASQLGHYYTGCDLPQMVVDREFRSDLFYRLKVVPVRLAALRKRREDITPLVRHFVNVSIGHCSQLCSPA
jgi:transcriptional regulator of aromatic amino acid metabolism